MTGLTAIDLFCGAGGLSAGFAQEGYEIALGLDNDESSVATYAANFGESAAVHADLLRYTAEDARRTVGDRIDVILGGPSCQPFSTHGRKERWVVGDPRSDLWSRMHSFVEELRPRAFVLENVPGMLYYKRGTFVSSLSKAFRALGYTLVHKIMLAADYNVPQLRRRLIVVGLLGDNRFTFPDSPRLGGWRRDSLAKWEQERISQNKLPHLTLREALGSLPAPVFPGQRSRYGSARPTTDYDAYMRTPWRRVFPLGSGSPSRKITVADHERVPIIEEVRELAKYVPPGGTWRNIPPHLLPDRFRSMRRTDGTNLYGRLVWDRPGYTITTQFQNITTGCFLHPDEDRPLTVREAARLQSFSDDFEFRGSLSSKARLVGNAVPPLLARVLARQLAAALGVDPRTSGPLVVGSERYRGEPLPDAAKTARIMRSAGRHDAAAAALVGLTKELDKAGLRFELGYADESVGVMPDVALPDERIAIFVQGCFIFGCGQHHRQTKSQEVWWKPEIARRIARREQERERLSTAGWAVHVIWEHEDPADVIERLGIAPAA